MGLLVLLVVCVCFGGGFFFVFYGLAFGALGLSMGYIGFLFQEIVIYSDFIVLRLFFYLSINLLNDAFLIVWGESSWRSRDV